MIRLDRVSHDYGNLRVLQDLSLSLGEGEVLGLFGHNGAGKTTTLKLILGLLRCGRGRVRVLEKDPWQPEVRRCVGYLPENVMFYPQLSGRETLLHFARLKQANKTQVDVLLQQVGLTEAAGRRVKTYSKGMRQRLGLAQALLGEPRLLLLDEPTVGLDPIATRQLYELLDQLRRRGTSVILCSHVLPGVEPHIDRAAILARGRLQAVGTLPELRRMAQLPVRIRLSGIAQRDAWLARWAQRDVGARAVNAQSVDIFTDENSKMGLLKTLLGESELGDLDIRQPGLEELYCHFTSLATAPPSEAASLNVAREECLCE